MKTKIFKILILTALFLLPLAAVRAADTKTGNSVYVAKDEIVSGNLYAAGGTITVDGTVSGDLIAAAQIINVNGRVEGDIIAAAQTIIINGEVGGNVRIAGNSLTLNGKVSRNVNAFGANIVFGADSRIGWDAYFAGANAEVRGTIDGGLSGQAGQVLVSGKIGKDLNLKLGKGGVNKQLTITPEAIINGDVIYASQNPANISDQANIAGKTQRNASSAENSNTLLSWIWKKLFTIFSALTVGLVLIFIGKNITTKILDQMEESPLKILVPGLIIMFVLPPIALILLFTIIGIPLALLIVVWWLMATYLAKIFTAILVGRLIINNIFKKNDWPLIYSLILGVIVCWLIFAIPFAGWLLALIAVWIGLGGIWSYVSSQLGKIS